MSRAGLWTAAAHLAAALQTTSSVAVVRKALPGPEPRFWSPAAKLLNNEVFSKYGSVKVHTMTLGWSLKYLGLTSVLMKQPDGKMALQGIGRTTTGSIAIVEWIRSRIVGYPSLLIPHIDAPGPYSDRVCMPGSRFPWFFDVRRTGLQLSNSPPDELSAFGGSTAGLSSAVVSLSQSLRGISEWEDFEGRRSLMTEEGKLFLSKGRDFYWKIASDDQVTKMVGTKIYRRVEFARKSLEDSRLALNEEAAEYWRSFERLDSVLEDMWLVIGQLAFYGPPAPVPRDFSIDWMADTGTIRVTGKAPAFAYRVGGLIRLPPALRSLGHVGVIYGIDMSMAAGDFTFAITAKVLQDSAVLGDGMPGPG